MPLNEDDLRLLAKRRGATRTSDVSPTLKVALEQGLLETKSLSEWLIVDRLSLAGAVFPHMGLGAELKSLRAAWLPGKSTAVQQSRRVAEAISAIGCYGSNTWASLANHPADIVREWAALSAGTDGNPSLPIALERMRQFAIDSHFSVREAAWMAVRDAIVDAPLAAIECLTPWTKDNGEGIRRFAVEATRPRGVWARHIPLLKAEPDHAEPLLEPLSADPSKYVRDSVANWLNDAAKTCPDWVLHITESWLHRSPTPRTESLVKRARRSIPM